MTDQQPTLEQLRVELSKAKDAADAAQKAVHAAEKIEKSKNLQKVLEEIKRLDLTREEVCQGMGWSVGGAAGGGVRKRKSTELPDKYRNPKNENETWSGQGGVPEWAKQYLLSVPGVKPRKFKEEMFNPARLKHDLASSSKGEKKA